MLGERRVLPPTACTSGIERIIDAGVRNPEPTRLCYDRNDAGESSHSQFQQALVFQIDEDMATRNAICGALMALYVDGRPRINTAGRGFACAAARTTCHPTQTATTSDPSSMVPRRALFAHALTLSTLAISSGLVPPPSLADAQPRASINVDPSNFDFPVIELPKDFVQLAYDLIDALRDAIEADLSGAPEREVRRKADPAKDLVKRFINSWSGSSAIADMTACSEIRAAVQELGEFYRINGQRAGMTKDFAERILGHLTEAEKALPEKPQKKSLLGL